MTIQQIAMLALMFLIVFGAGPDHAIKILILPNGAAPAGCPSQLVCREGFPRAQNLFQPMIDHRLNQHMDMVVHDDIGMHGIAGSVEMTDRSNDAVSLAI